MANLVIKNKSAKQASLTFDIKEANNIELRVEDGVFKIIKKATEEGSNDTTLLTIDNYLQLNSNSYGVELPGDNEGSEGSIFFKIIGWGE